MKVVRSHDGEILEIGFADGGTARLKLNPKMYWLNKVGSFEPVTEKTIQLLWDRFKEGLNAAEGRRRQKIG